MPEVKQPFEINQQTFSKALVGLVRQRGKELDISNQMGQTKLLKAVGVLDIGAEKVADDSPAVRFSENLFEDLGSSRLGDAKETDHRCAENPDPVFQALVLPAGLVDVQDRLSGNVFGKLLIRSGQSVVDASDGIAQVASGRVDVQHLATELFQAGIAGVERTLHVGDQSLQARGEQLPFNHTGREFCPNLWLPKTPSGL